jgi:hypothetical protein
MGKVIPLSLPIADMKLIVTRKEKRMKNSIFFITPP